MLLVIEITISFQFDGFVDQSSIVFFLIKTYQRLQAGRAVN